MQPRQPRDVENLRGFADIIGRMDCMFLFVI